MQGTIHVDIEELAKTYGIERLGYAQILMTNFGRRQTLVLTPKEDEPVEYWLPKEVTG